MKHSLSMEDLAKKLCLQVTQVTNRSFREPFLGLPEIVCTTEVFPDFLAQCNQPSLFHKTELTGVTFNVWDNEFDGENGLYNAIYYKREERLDYFRKRFEGVKIFLSPDCSLMGDIDFIENLYRLKRIHVISLWLQLECHAIVIPNITYPNREFFTFMLLGYERCSCVSFSTKGTMNSPTDISLMQDAVKYTVDNLNNLKTIIVFNCCGDESKSRDLFKYAEEKGITVLIPPTVLSERNKILSEMHLAR